MNQDASHLRTLSILHYVLGGLNACSALFFTIYICLGVSFTQIDPPISKRPPMKVESFSTSADPDSARLQAEIDRRQAEEDFENHQREITEFAKNTMGTMFIVLGSAMFLLLGALSVLNIIAGRNLGKMKSRTFCMVVSGCNCVIVPLGTTLAIFTFIVLSRPSVVALFEQNKIVEK